MQECSKSITAETVTSNSFEVFLLKMTEYIDKAKMGGSYVHKYASKKTSTAKFDGMAFRDNNGELNGF